MHDKIVKIIIDEVQEINDQLSNPISVEKGKDTPLFGGDGLLDSIALVSLVVAVEQAVEDEFGAAIILANEKAMSMRNSPFTTIGSLSDYIVTLLKEEEIDG